MRYDSNFQTSSGRINPMLNHRHYIPVLRWKEAERIALCKLAPDVRSHITPIIEFVPWEYDKKSMVGELRSKAKEITESWGWTNQVFVDLSLLGDQRAAQGIPTFTQAADRYGLLAGVVTGLFRPKAYQAAIRKSLANNNRELCL